MRSSERSPSSPDDIDRATLDLFPEIVWLSGPDGEFRAFNRAWAAFAGETGGPQETREQFQTMLHPDDRVRIFELWDRVAAEGTPFEVEFRLRGRDGASHWFASRGTPLRDRAGALTGWLGTMRTIDAEHAARERAALVMAVNALFARGPGVEGLINGLVEVLVPRYADYVAIDLFDAQGGFERCVTAGPEPLRRALLAARERYAKARPDELAGTSWHVAATGETIIFSAALPADASPDSVRTNLELGVRSAVVVPLADGSRRIGALSLGRVDAEAGIYESDDLPFYVDLAARAAAAIAHARVTADLVDSEQRYRTLADGMAQLVRVMRPDGTVAYANEPWRAFTGLRGDVDDWLRLVHPDDLAAYVAGWEAAAASAEPWETQYRLRRHDGVFRWVLSRIRPVRDDAGGVRWWIGTATDIDERKRDEDAMRVLLAANAAFAGTLDATVALQQLADICAEHLADWCAVYVSGDDGRLRPVAIAHRDRAQVRFVREYFRRFPVGDDSPATSVARTGVPFRMNEIDPAVYEELEDPEQRAFLTAMAIRAVLFVPLGDGERRYGAFSLGSSREDRRFDEEDERIATLIAQRATIAIESARLYERQREVARTLQESFLPAAFPSSERVAFDAIYAAGTRDLTVGGDWYDAFAVGETRIALSVGDVAGHGLDAAVPMGKMRQTFRALGAIERDPAGALVAADAVLRREHADVFVTAFLAVFDTVSRRIEYASAGHPAPFVRGPGGTLRRLAASGVPLGLGDRELIHNGVDRLAPGELIVLFTDGLIESTHDIDEGERRLAEALAHPAFGVCSAPAALLQALLVPSIPDDDVAILCARLAAPASWSLDANDAAAGYAARSAFAAALAAAGLGEQARLAGELIVGEILANVARYTPGVVDLALEEREGTLVLSALDRGPGFTWRAQRPADDSENGRGLFLIDALGAAARVEYLTGFGTYVEVVLGS